MRPETRLFCFIFSHVGSVFLWLPRISNSDGDVKELIGSTPPRVANRVQLKTVAQLPAHCGSDSTPEGRLASVASMRGSTTMSMYY